MARTDYKALKERYLKRQNQGEGGDKRFFKFKTPEVKKAFRYKIRILPPVEGQSVFEWQYGLHYGVDENHPVLVCPKKTRGLPCPICEFVRGLWKDGGDENEQLARDIGSKTRFLANILDMRKPGEVFLLEYGTMISDQIAEIITSSESGIIPVDDPEKGHVLTVLVKSERVGKKTFPKYVVTADPVPSKIPDMGVLDKLHDGPAIKLAELKTYDQLEAILNNDPEPEGEAATETTEPEPEQVDEVVEETPDTTDEAPADDATSAPPTDDPEEITEDPEDVEVVEPDEPEKKEPASKKGTSTDDKKTGKKQSSIQRAREALKKKQRGTK